MTTVTEGAYIAALEKKLVEAERALYGFRCIWNNLASNEGIMGEAESGSGSPVGTGEVHGKGQCDLYPGQIRPPDECEE